VSGAGQEAQGLDETIRERATRGETLTEVVQLGLLRQLAVEQEEGGLFKGAVLSELFDRDSAVLKDASLAVDVADRRLSGGDPS
jgi:hypothetical protein